MIRDITATPLVKGDDGILNLACPHSWRAYFSASRLLRAATFRRAHYQLGIQINSLTIRTFSH